MSIYARRKIDVESFFGHLKGYLKFTRFSVRGINKVKRETGIVLTAMNIIKIASLVTNFLLLNVKMVLVGRNYYFFRQEPFILRSYVTAPFCMDKYILEEKLTMITQYLYGIGASTIAKGFGLKESDTIL
ncbi:transposase [Lactobacillus sp. Sy-1]|nr:transposase [Lactobacillus sp. Sy-1]